MRLIAAAAACLLLACGNSEPDRSSRVIRVGYFPNLTHSQALIGLSRGDFARALPGTEIRPSVFNAGPTVIEAIFASEIDLAYVGPNPAINGWVQSRGKALRIVAGAASGGASLVVRRSAAITTPAALSGRALATPQLGNTQDVALRHFLRSHGLAEAERGGSVRVIPSSNPEIMNLFRRGEIDGAWVPEPWASRLVVEADGTILVDERSLWPEGQFVTAQLIVSSRFLERHPELVERWLDAHVEITRWALEHPSDARTLVNQQLATLTGKPLAPQVLMQAWSRVTPTWDPLPSTLRASADAAFEAGFLREKPDLEGIYALEPLNAVLGRKGIRAVHP